MILEILCIIFLVLALPGALPNSPWPQWPGYLFLWLAVVCLAVKVLHPAFG